MRCVYHLLVFNVSGNILSSFQGVDVFEYNLFYVIFFRYGGYVYPLSSWRLHSAIGTYKVTLTTMYQSIHKMKIKR